MKKKLIKLSVILPTLIVLLVLVSGFVYSNLKEVTGANVFIRFEISDFLRQAELSDYETIEEHEIKSETFYEYYHLYRGDEVYILVLSKASKHFICILDEKNNQLVLGGVDDAIAEELGQTFSNYPRPG